MPESLILLLSGLPWAQIGLGVLAVLVFGLLLWQRRGGPRGVAGPNGEAGWDVSRQEDRTPPP